MNAIKTKSNRKTHEKYAEEFYDLVGDYYTLLSRYKGSNEKVTVRHEGCGKVYDVEASAFLRGSRCHKCPYYMAEELRSIYGDEYIVTGEFTGWNDKTTVLHSVCGKEYTSVPSDLKRGRRLCHCAKKPHRKRMDSGGFFEEARKKVGKEFSFLSDFVGMKEPIRIKHNVCGREFETSPNNFLYTKNNCVGCPSVFEDKVRKLVGGEYVVSGNYVGFDVPLGFIHVDCGTKFDARPTDFISHHRRCPRCVGRVHRDNEMFVADVYRLVGDEYVFLEVFLRFADRMLVRHNTCRHIYSVNSWVFFKGYGRCPKCHPSLSRGEERVKSSLERYDYVFETEKIFSELSPRRFDFYITSLNACIEYDGDHHFVPVDFFGGRESLERNKMSDHVKNEYCANNGIHLLRIPYWDFDRVDEIVTDFINEIKTNPDELITPNYVPLIQRTPSLT